MIYLISLAIYLVVLGAGMYIVKTRPKQAEKFITKICAVGFILQLCVNYLFWGNIAAFNPLSTYVSIERSAVNLMFLGLVSIFCYAGLLVMLSKADEFYND